MITLTDAAVSRIKGIIQETPDASGKVLRLFVEGGGCAGFQYGFAFDDKKEGDSVTAHDGFELAIDPASLNYLNGTSIDYVESLEGAGFKIENPNASGGCGCGKSFTA
jgi:iron-sulfur cluster assembly accessory protein